MTGLIIQSLTATYGSAKILHDISLPTLSPGNVIMVLGANGSGKSTFLKSLIGFCHSQGTLNLKGENLRQLSLMQRAKRVGYLPQSLLNDTHLRVIEAIKFAAQLSNAIDDWQKIVQVLQQLRIENLAMQYVDELSGGQKQLVGLAQSLIREPQVWLLDEPLSALDLQHQVQVMEVIKDETIRRQLITVVIVHDINIALRYADNILFLKEGHLVAYGRAQQVITPQMLAQVYGVKARIEYCSQMVPYIVIDGVIT